MTPLCVIVRHGNTFGPGEPPRRIGIATNLPLVDSGREQAVKLGAYFASRGWRFERALASSLARTLDTAALILSHVKDPPAVEQCSWLAEIDHGLDENRTEEEVLSRIGEEALAAWDARAAPPPSWKVDAHVRLTAWRSLFASRPSGRTLLVTSNGAARFGLLANNAIAEQASSLPSLKLATGSFGLISLEEAGPQLLAWNQHP